MSHRHQLLSLRLLILLTALGIVFLLLSGRVAASTPPAAPVTYRVEAGDTLWHIAAARSDPEDDVRSVVREIKAINDLTESSLRQGQVLLLPAG